MNSELKTLKKIWDNEGNSCIRLVSHQTGFDIDYTRYICNCLLKKEQIRPVKGRRDWYQITARGRKDLELRQLIKPQISRKTSKIEKVIYYLPKKLKKPRRGSQKDVVTKPKDVSIKADEQKMNVWRSIVKAVSFLKKVE